MIIDETAYLEHYGVKGMKWGVRKEQRAYKMKRTALQKMENRARRKAGKETLPGKKVGVGERLRTYGDTVFTPTTIKDLVTTRSLNEAQLRKADRIQGRIDRRKKGEASVGDKLAYYANVRNQDLLPTKKGPNDTRINVGASFTGLLMAQSAVPMVGSLAGLGVSKVNQKRKSRKE